MAKILPIITHPNKILRKKSEEIETDRINTKEFGQLAQDMTKTMLEKDGIGLSAPQVGKNIRLIVVNTKDGVLVMFNPRITKKSWLKQLGQEGCLSVPNTFGSVKRCKKILCYFFDRKGDRQKIKAEGLLARVIQHEIDHLNGVLFIDKAKNIQKITDTSPNDSPPVLSQDKDGYYNQN